MNSIKASQSKSKFAQDKHLVLCVDGQTLDLIVAQFANDDWFEGLVPTLLDWLEDPKERSIVWGRVLPNTGTKAIFPVLMCPDDCDFSCTVIVTEVEADESQVVWHRFGRDETSERHISPEKIGQSVEWIYGLGPFIFPRIEYDKCISTFRGQLGGEAA
jgi:hypothetical protein